MKTYPTMYHLLMDAYLAETSDDEEDWVDAEIREAERV